MTTKVVLDTNVVVSANLVDEGFPAAILDLAINRKILMIVSSPVLEEYEEVLHRPRLKLDPARVGAVMALIRKNSLLVRPTITAVAASDESDNRFLECASAARADYIVTGNTNHFPETFERTRVVTPRQFVNLILPLVALRLP